MINVKNIIKNGHGMILSTKNNEILFKFKKEVCKMFAMEKDASFAAGC